MSMTPFQTIALICTIPFVIWAVVQVFDFFDTRAREQRWQRALASFNMADTRTPLTDPVTTRKPRGEYGVTSCAKLGGPSPQWLAQRVGADLDNAREQLKGPTRL